VKCNPDGLVLKLLAQLGTGFDCASHAEIEMVLKLGVEPCRIIYANPCKAGSFVRHAHAKGVQMMTFDNQDELEKVAKFHPNARMVLRILTDDSGSLCRLGERSSAPPSRTCVGCWSEPRSSTWPSSAWPSMSAVAAPTLLYTDAVGRAKWTFELGQELGFDFDFLDVGGGFGDDNFDLLAQGLLAGLDKHFPVGCGVRVIAEPGRYFVTRAFELATNIIARRKAPTPPPSALPLTADDHADDLAPKDQQDSPLTMCE
jgi:ornithine decarboxylase